MDSPGPDTEGPLRRASRAQVRVADLPQVMEPQRPLRYRVEVKFGAGGCSVARSAV